MHIPPSASLQPIRPFLHSDTPPIQDSATQTVKQMPLEKWALRMQGVKTLRAGTQAVVALVSRDRTPAPAKTSARKGAKPGGLTSSLDAELLLPPIRFCHATLPTGCQSSG
mgnify:CR=1 FL=1